MKLGGTLEVDHEAWLLHCLRSMTNREQHGDGTGEGTAISAPQCALASDGADLTSSSSSLSLSVSSSVVAAADAATKALLGNGMTGIGSQSDQVCNFNMNLELLVVVGMKHSVFKMFWRSV